MPRVPLRDLAVTRGGDKGGNSHLPLLIFDRKNYEAVRQQVTAERVADLLKDEAPGGVERYELPNLPALNFVLIDALDGGRSRMLRFDPRFVFGERLLDLEIELPD